LRLILKKPYQSIKKLNNINLPNFTVITGLNGTGKSHLLSAISNSSIQVDDINKDKIILFNSTSFNLTYESSIGSDRIEKEYTKINASFKQRQTLIKKLIDNYPNYDNIKQICLTQNKKFLDLNEKSFTNIDEFNKYKEFTTQYKQKLLNFNQGSREQYSQVVSYGNSLLDVASKIQYSIHELDTTEFRKLYIPYSYSKALLPESIGLTFWDYYLKYDENKYLRYINSIEGVSENHPKALSDEEFISLYGERPWIILNNILNEFESIKYHVNSPEGLYRDDSYQYKLISNTIEDLTIQHSSLSSGERILMALVGLIYKLKLDNNLPELILFDEVDSSLHPSMIKMFLQVINKTLVNTNVILVTHSPTMVALTNEDSIYVMNRDTPNRLTKESKQNALSILTEGFATINDINPTLSIEYNLSKTNLPVLFTEGITDKIIIQTAWDKLYPDENMPFYIQDCFDASFLANLFKRGDDAQDGIFKTYSDKKLIALFDFDSEGYNAWNGLSKFTTNIELNPRNCLTKNYKNAFALLLPVPNNDILKQVIREKNITFKNKSMLSIELLFYGQEELSSYFIKENILGGGEIIKFKGNKRNFAKKIETLDSRIFTNINPLLQKLIEIC